MKHFFLTTLMTILLVPVLQAQSPPSQQILNDAAAVAQEALFTVNYDSVRSDKTVSTAHALIRYSLKQQDRNSREWQVGFQNKIIYRLLVQQFNYLIRDVNEMFDNARKHPEHMPACITAGSEILLKAYSLGKHAVVVAMNSKVPLPWKVDYDKFLEGKDNTPIYANDKEKGKNDDDRQNLLLPSERYNILNSTLSQVMDLRVAIRAVNSKLSVDMTWQKGVMYALKFDNYVHEAHQNVFRTFSREIANRPVP